MAVSSVAKKLPEFINQGVNNGRADGKALSVAYVNESGQPVLSLRGSVHVYSDHQLSLWIRHAEGGMATAIRSHPKVALLYRDHDSRATYTFEGEAHVVTDEAGRNSVFEVTPLEEQQHDPERKGAAIIIDVTSFRAKYATLPGMAPRETVDISFP